MDIQAYIQSGIIESYVLGLASTDEVAEVESLQTKYPEISQAITEFSMLIEEQTRQNAIQPPSRIKDKFLATVFDKTKNDFAVIGSTALSSSSQRIKLSRFAVAASIILFIASAVLNMVLYKKYSDKNNEYQALVSQRNSLLANNQIYQTRLQQWQTTAEMMADTGFVLVKLKGTPGKTANLATVLWNTANKDVYLVPTNLPEPEEGKQFQLWALVNGKPVDAGMVDKDCTGACKMKNIPRAQAFAITLEKEGGSPTPNLKELYVMGEV